MSEFAIKKSSNEFRSTIVQKSYYLFFIYAAYIHLILISNKQLIEAILCVQTAIYKSNLKNYL